MSKSHGSVMHDIFVTDVEYDADEKELGFVQTGAGDGIVGSTTVRLNSGHSQDLLAFIELTEDSIVRFTSTVVNAVTDYTMVRSITRTAISQTPSGLDPGGGVVDGEQQSPLSFVVDAPLLMPAASEYRLQLVREWIPRSLKLQSRFQLVTACEVKAFCFAGLSPGNMYEQHDFIGLEIKEIPGTVKSTNRHMQNMLAVLPTHMPAYHPSAWLEARDAIIYMPEGTAKSQFDSPLPAVNSITPRLVDRRGNTVKAARFHLWLRLWAEVL